MSDGVNLNSSIRRDYTLRVCIVDRNPRGRMELPKNMFSVRNLFLFALRG